MGSNIQDYSNKTAPNSSTNKMAYNLLVKMGWKEGKGLGKNEDGISSNLKIKKREDNQGLGAEALSADSTMVGGSEWWHATYSNNLELLKKCKKKKQKTVNKDAHHELNGVEINIQKGPSFEELFIATGGVRLGMRARSEQKGKIKRTEGIKIKESELNDNPVSMMSSIETISNDNDKTNLKHGKENKKRKRKKDKKEPIEKEEA